MKIMEELPPSSFDLILCDLPYGTTSCSWDSILPVNELWDFYRKLLTPTGTVILTANQPFTTIITQPALDLFKYACVWIKNVPTLPHHAKNRPMGKHEDVLVFSKGKMGHVSQCGEKRMTYNPQGVYSVGKKVVTEKNFSRITGPRPNQVGTEFESFAGFPNTILEFDKDQDHVHPTQKPIELISYLVKTYSNPGDLVLDNCMGSGTTGVACVQENRKFVGIEQNSEYFEIAKNRIQEAIDSPFSPGEDKLFEFL